MSDVQRYYPTSEGMFTCADNLRQGHDGFHDDNDKFIEYVKAVDYDALAYRLDLTERQRDLANDCIKIENERAVEAERQLAKAQQQIAKLEFELRNAQTCNKGAREEMLKADERAEQAEARLIALE